MPIEQVHEFKRPDKAESADLTRRAAVAYLREGGTDSPDLDTSGVRVHQGLGYVVLRGASGVLAVYRIRPDTYLLRRMKRWPTIIERV